MTKRPSLSLVLAWICGAITAVVILHCTGCAPEGVEYAEKPRQAEALHIVWDLTYGLQDTTPPAIEWVEGAALNCGDGTGFRLADGECVYGVSEVATNTVRIAWPAGGMEWWRLPFAHELGHAASYRQTGDEDCGHVGPYFLGGKSNEAQQALIDSGIDHGM